MTCFRLGALSLIGAFIAASLILFEITYRDGAGNLMLADQRYAKDFYLTFYVFFAGSSLGTVLFLFSRNAISGILLVFISVSSSLLLSYSLADFLTIRLWLFASFVTAVAARFAWPHNIISSAASSALFILAQLTPPLLGDNLLRRDPAGVGRGEIVTFSIALLSIAAVVSALRLATDLLDKANRQTALLDGTITKLSEFNQTLQNYARTADENATKKERYRISREIHDISGYIFTNIIALMDAAISTGCQNPEQTSEICLTARIQAQEGIQETRRALRALRGLNPDRERGLRAVYKIKGIFEETTNVAVKIESGNSPASFGEEIDLIVYRTVQEALTNALRHGHATCVNIDFCVDEANLYMKVRDNGLGAKKLTRGIGLAGMEERIGQLNGSVEAANAAEGGFLLSIRIPLPEGERA